MERDSYSLLYPDDMRTIWYLVVPAGRSEKFRSWVRSELIRSSSLPPPSLAQITRLKPAPADDKSTSSLMFVPVLVQLRSDCTGGLPGGIKLILGSLIHYPGPGGVRFAPMFQSDLPILCLHRVSPSGLWRYYWAGDGFLGISFHTFCPARIRIWTKTKIRQQY